MAKVKKTNSPLVVIGLGGTGSEMARRIKSTFQERLELEPERDCPPHTRFVIIDTDKEEQKRRGWSDSEFLDISGNFAQIKAGNLQAWEEQWFDQMFSDSDNLLGGGNGGGVYRQIARLYMFRKIPDLKNKLVGVINAVRTVQLSEKSVAKLEIFVLAGISGGTGSGTFLDIAYLLRDWIEHDSELGLTRDQYSLEAMLVMPDATIREGAAGDPIKTKLYSQNGYAALKELDFWMAYAQHEHKYEQKYDAKMIVKWEGKPYDDVFLLASSTVDHSLFDKPYDHIMQAAAEFMVTSFSDGAVTEINKAANATTYPQSFDSIRSNNLSHSDAIDKPYPVSYAYSSIGAFSNVGDEENIHTLQWKLIIDETCNRINAGEKAVDMKGPIQIDIEKICIKDGIGVEDGSTTFKEYKERNEIQKLWPDNFGVGTLKAMDYNSAPHGSDFEAFRKNVEMAHGGERKLIRETGWTVIKKYVEGIVKDLNKGPAYAQTVITSEPNGIKAKLKAELQKAQAEETKAKTYVLEYQGIEGECNREFSKIKEASYGNFANWFKFGAQRQTYQTNTEDLYAGMRRAGYMKALQCAIEDIIVDLEKYDVLLGEMVHGIREKAVSIDQSLAARRSGNANVSLLDSNKVQTSLVAAFNANAAGQTMAQKALETIAEKIDKAMELNAKNFTDEHVANILQEGIESLRGECFGQIDAMDVQGKIMAFGKNYINGQTMDEYTKNILMPGLERGAMPMFNTAYELDKNNSVNAYMGVVPSTANDIIMGINEYMAKDGMSNTYANLKAGGMEDRIFWVTYLFGMPLRAYMPLKGYFNVYLAMRNQHRGTHLCMAEGCHLSDPYRQDWTELPDPRCFRSKAEGDAEKRVHKVMDAGVLKIDVSLHVIEGQDQNVPKAVVCWKRLQPIQQEAAVITVAQAEKEIARVEQEIAAPDTRVEAIRRRIDQAVKIPLTVDNLDAKANEWAKILGTATELETPILNTMDDDLKEDLKDKWRAAYERAVFETISRNAQLLHEMEVNADCRGKFEEAAAKWSKPDPVQLKNNAITFGEMYRYGLITKARSFCYFVNDALAASNNQIDKQGDGEHDAAMKSNFPCFEEYSIFLRNLIYYSAAIANIDPRDTLQRGALAKIAAVINDAEYSDTIPKSMPEYVSNAQALLEVLNGEYTQIDMLFGGQKMLSAERDMLRNLLDEIKKKNEDFVKNWR